jgi:hypothetical protein
MVKKVSYSIGIIMFILGLGLFISVFSKSTVDIKKDVASPEITEDEKEKKLKDLVLTPPQPKFPYTVTDKKK